MIAENLRKCGDNLFSQGKVAEDILYYQEALQHNPHYAEVYNNLGLAFKHQNRLEEAIGCYHKALEANPH